MQAAEEEIKGQAPEGYIGEVGKGATGVLRTTVRAIPAEDDENGDECPKREGEAHEGENGRREQPRGCVAACRVERARDTEETVEHSHFNYRTEYIVYIGKGSLGNEGNDVGNHSLFTEG